MWGERPQLYDRAHLAHAVRTALPWARREEASALGAGTAKLLHVGLGNVGALGDVLVAAAEDEAA